MSSVGSRTVFLTFPPKTEGNNPNMSNAKLARLFFALAGAIAPETNGSSSPRRSPTTAAAEGPPVLPPATVEKEDHSQPSSLCRLSAPLHSWGCCLGAGLHCYDLRLLPLFALWLPLALVFALSSFFQPLPMARCLPLRRPLRAPGLVRDLVEPLPHLLLG